MHQSIWHGEPFGDNGTPLRRIPPSRDNIILLNGVPTSEMTSSIRQENRGLPLPCNNICLTHFCCFSWYFGPMSRQDATDLLMGEKEGGVFLVRDSTTIHGDFVLCVREDSKVSHYIINKIQQGEQTRYRIGDQMFPDLPACLQFYKLHYLDTTPLIRPAPRRIEKVIAKYDFEGSVCNDVAAFCGLPTEYKYMTISHTSSSPVTERDVIWTNIIPGDGLDATGLLHGRRELPLLYLARDAAHLPMNITVARGPNFVVNAMVGTLNMQCSTTQDQDDLPFKKGEILTVVSKDEDQWWTARNTLGQTGSIPVPYIQKYEDNQQCLNEIQRPGSGGGNPVSQQEAAIRRTNIQRKLPAYARVKQARVPNAYDKTALKLEVGDIIKVTKMNINGQWEGELNGKVGHFPFTHVEFVDAENNGAGDES
uniref:Adapter molecule Crk n=1 Tax=Timema douglasi TaxID=61478 RepID=A0A7R8VKM4_TIMDO|nr:unnamed protein product [Timema douglasi]